MKRLGLMLAVGGALLARVPAGAEIRVVGSDLLGDGFARVVADYARQSGTVVRLDLRGSRPGVVELEQGRADVALLLLPAGEDPPAAPLVSRVIAYEVAVVMVPAVSPLRQVTGPQLRGLFGQSAGDRFTRWGELNLIGEWNSRPVALLADATGVSFSIFREAILGGGAARPALERLPDDAALIQRLAATVNAIAVAGHPASPDDRFRVLSLAASPTEPAYGPTVENVHAGNYPLRLPLQVAFARAAAPGLQPFLKFLLSDAAGTALAPAHFVGLPAGVRQQLLLELEEIR